MMNDGGRTDRHLLQSKIHIILILLLLRLYLTEVGSATRVFSIRPTLLSLIVFSSTPPSSRIFPLTSVHFFFDPSFARFISASDYFARLLDTSKLFQPIPSLAFRLPCSLGWSEKTVNHRSYNSRPVLPHIVVPFIASYCRSRRQ